MEKFIPSITSWGIIVVTLITMARVIIIAGDVIPRGSLDSVNRIYEIINTDIRPVSTNFDLGRSNIYFSIKNDGTTQLSDFTQWDVIIQYYDVLNVFYTYWLPYQEGIPDINQWSIIGIYSDNTMLTPEFMNPNTLDPGEVMLIQTRLDPTPSSTAWGNVTIATPNGVTSWNTFKLNELYLQNYPTPPTDNTSASSLLLMDANLPTQTTLFNYDTNYNSDPGRTIIRSAASSGESDLRKYQNWVAGNSIGIFDSLEFDTDKGMSPDIIHINGDVYAIAYQGENNDGFLKTVSISSNGTIADTIIDTLEFGQVEFDTTDAEKPKLLHISGPIFAVCYTGSDEDGFLKTVLILSSGTIGDKIVLDGDIRLILWSGTRDFQESQWGNVTAYLRDCEGATCQDIASTTLVLADWQDGATSWVDRTLVFSDISYTGIPNHYLELKVLVSDNSSTDMMFAYDTADYPSRLQLVLADP